MTWGYFPAVEHQWLTPEVATVLAALLVFIPATISAIASIRNRRQMRTSNGRTAGQLIETTAHIAVSNGHRLDSVENTLTAHLDTDLASFAEIRQILDKQTELMEHIKENQS